MAALVSENKWIVRLRTLHEGSAPKSRGSSPVPTHVLVSYREKTKRAQTIAEGISAAGGHASIVQADLSNDQERDAMLADIQQQH